MLKCIEQSRTQEQCTFQPQINKSTSSLNPKGQEGFIERMDRLSKDRLAKQQQSQILKDSVVKEDELGNPMFKPTIGRPPKNRADQRPIGEKLYEDAVQRSKKMEGAKKKTEKSISEQSSKSKMNSISDTYLETKKRKRFEQLFSAFDSDKDGLISANAIEIRSVPADLLEIFAPVLCEMEDLQVQLDLETFCDVTSKLFNSLSPYEKDKVLYGQKKTFVDENCTFKVKPPFFQLSHLIFSKNSPSFQKSQCEWPKKKKNQAKKAWPVGPKQ